VEREAHWIGGPNFAIEIVSEGDRTREKLPLFAKVGTHELLIVDRDRSSLEHYRLLEDELQLVGQSTDEQTNEVRCETVPLSFRLTRVGKKARIDVAQLDGEGHW
jgi:Uma2 family endonuclease